MIIECDFPLERTEGRKLVLNTPNGFPHEDGLDASTHHRIVASLTNGLLEPFLKSSHDDVVIGVELISRKQKEIKI